MPKTLEINPGEINIKLLGDAEKDTRLVKLLLKELTLLRGGQGGKEEEEEEERQFELSWKTVALAKRCNMVSAVHADAAEATDEIMEELGKGRETQALRKILSEYSRRRGKNTTAQKQADRVETDKEAMERLTAFYGKVNPEKTEKDVKRIWSKGRLDPKILHKRYLETYGEVAERELGWMQGFPPAKVASEKTATPPTKKKPEPRSHSTPAKSGGGNVVGSFIGAIASPVVKLFRPEVDENEFPQAILPNDDDEKDHYFDEKEGRWIFPSDPEGEAERRALAEAKKGPPPKPVSAPQPPSASSSTGLKYVDPFNSAGGSSAGPPAPAPAAPPMPPTPIFTEE